MQVIGSVFNDPKILEEQDKYVIREEDFTEEFHKIVFGAMYNIVVLGGSVNLETIVDYLSTRPKFYGIFQQNKGVEYITKASEFATRDTFNYYYTRLKKMTLLRAYDNYGIDVSFLYDPTNVLDTKKKQEQEEWLDNTSVKDIVNLIDERIDRIKSEYADEECGDGYQIGDGALELISQFEKCPEVGIPLYGPLINTVTRGARLKKYYLRSASTGTGKTRSMVADACNFASDEIYEPDFGMWIKNGKKEPTLFIATEQDITEMQTMAIAFLSDVNEAHILNGKYDEGERERVIKAAKKMQEIPLWVECIPDFSIADIENTIKRYIREHDVKYVCLDYLKTSMKILEEITRRSGGVRLREDNILFMFSVRLKDLCNQYGIFILSATQLNGDFRDAEVPDQNLLRGAKSIGDALDVGMILLEPTKDDLVKIEPIIASSPRFKVPNIKLSIYKNRRGSYKGVYLWCDADLGTCRIKPMFCTNYRHELKSIEDIKIMVDDGPSAF